MDELKDSGRYLAFFMLDIDYFKFYNDHFGHQKGDEALKRVAIAVNEFMQRQHGLVFRMGGEEFAGILVTNTPYETSEWLAKMVAEVEALKIVHAPESGQSSLTISMGIYPSKVNDLNSLDAIYKTADLALYQAKNKGRNQAVIIPTNE